MIFVATSALKTSAFYPYFRTELSHFNFRTLPVRASALPHFRTLPAPCSSRSDSRTLNPKYSQSDAKSKILTVGR